MSDRRTDLLDAAVTLLGRQGVRGVTHRAVDTASGLPAGSTSNYFRTSDALLGAVVERFAARERDHWEELAATLAPTTPAELGRALGAFAVAMTTRYRDLTLSRYAILVEAANRPALQELLDTTGSRVAAYFTTWLRLVGSAHPERDTALTANCFTGYVLHQLARPRPGFDPTPALTALLESLTAGAAVPTKPPHTKAPTIKGPHTKPPTTEPSARTPRSRRTLPAGGG